MNLTYLRLILAILFLLLGLGWDRTESSYAQGISAPTAATVDTERRDLELKKIIAETAKIERDTKYWYLPALITIVPFLGVVLTILIQRKSALDIQRRTEQASLEMKIAEIVMASPTPGIASARMEILTQLYSGRIRPEFVRNFDIDRFAGTRLWEMKMVVFKLLAENPDKRESILSALRKTFPEDKDRWIDPLFLRNDKVD